MAAKLEKTRHPGIYKRGGRYAVIFRDGDGRQRQLSARTLDEARKMKAARTADVARGEFHPASRDTFREYSEAWVERYQGTGRRGFRESTREDYRRMLRDFAYPYFGRRRLTELTPADIAGFIGWLADPRAQAQRRHDAAAERAREEGKRPPAPLAPDAAHPLSDSTIRNVLNPVRSCFATAVREGKVRHNPTIAATLPHRERIADEDDVEVRAFTREQLAVLLAIVHPRHRTMFRLLAVTGLRISELIALQWRHLRLDGPQPCVRVRRALVRGREEPPKSKYGRRDVPLDQALVSELRRRRDESESPGDEQLVFASQAGTPLSPDNLRRRALRPAAEEAGAEWAGFHTFRHTCAAVLFERGLNVKQVQRWLGHHSPSFTLDTYVHLLDERLPEPVDLEVELAGVSEVSASAASGEDRSADQVPVEVAV